MGADPLDIILTAMFAGIGTGVGIFISQFLLDKFRKNKEKIVRILNLNNNHLEVVSKV